MLHSMQPETLHSRRDSRSRGWASSSCLTERALYVVCGMSHSCHVCMLHVGHSRCSRRYREPHLQPSAQLRLAELGLLRERLDEILHREQPGLHSFGRNATRRTRMLQTAAPHRSAARSAATRSPVRNEQAIMGSADRWRTEAERVQRDTANSESKATRR